MMVKSLLNTSLYPRCQTLFDEKCNIGYFARESPIMTSNCKVQCNIKEYTAQVSENGIELKNDGSKRPFVMLIRTSELRTVTNEYLIYNTAGMVGNIDGSLGLFLGCLGIHLLMEYQIPISHELSGIFHGFCGKLNST